jgi:hypothetical protein
MPSTTEAPLTWPTRDAFARTGNCLATPVEQVSTLYEELSKIVPVEESVSYDGVRDVIERGADPVSYELVGAFTTCLAKLRVDLEYLLETVRKMERQRNEIAIEIKERDAG